MAGLSYQASATTLSVKGSYEFVIEFDMVACVYNGNPCKLDEFESCTLQSSMFGFNEVKKKCQKMSMTNQVVMSHCKMYISYHVIPS